jgi:hypothetical protein
MPAPVVFNDVAPVVPVRNLRVALERYRQLGFEVQAYGHGTGYGFAQRGAVSIHLSEWDEHDPKRTGAVVYLYVSDADAVRAEWASCGVEGRVSVNLATLITECESSDSWIRTVPCTAWVRSCLKGPTTGSRRQVEEAMPSPEG